MKNLQKIKFSFLKKNTRTVKTKMTNCQDKEKTQKFAFFKNHPQNIITMIKEKNEQKK